MFDYNVLTVASGFLGHTRYAVDRIEAVPELTNDTPLLFIL